MTPLLPQVSTATPARRLPPPTQHPRIRKRRICEKKSKAATPADTTANIRNTSPYTQVGQPLQQQQNSKRKQPNSPQSPQYQRQEKPAADVSEFRAAPMKIHSQISPCHSSPHYTRTILCIITAASLILTLCRRLPPLNNIRACTAATGNRALRAATWNQTEDKNADSSPDSEEEAQQTPHEEHTQTPQRNHHCTKLTNTCPSVKFFRGPPSREMKVRPSCSDCPRGLSRTAPSVTVPASAC